MKTLDEQFCDWEEGAFGFGYGTGEKYILPSLYTFLDNCRGGDTGTCYNHCVLESVMTPAVAWLMINVLCQQHIITYGTSPRNGWLTKEGIELKKFVLSKTPDELVNLVCSRTCEDTVCYRDGCNCGGYEEGKVCENVFWGTKSK